MSVIREMSCSDAPHHQILPVGAVGQSPYPASFALNGVDCLTSRGIPNDDLFVQVLSGSEPLAVGMPRQTVDNERCFESTNIAQIDVRTRCVRSKQRAGKNRNKRQYDAKHAFIDYLEKCFHVSLSVILSVMYPSRFYSCCQTIRWFHFSNQPEK